MDVYILSGSRTANGAFLGALSTVPAPQLGGHAIKESLKKADLSAEAVNEVFMGNVLMAGLGQAPARQATLAAGLSDHVPATTLNKVCGSGLQAIIFGARMIALGEANCVVAGGMENMSLAPFLAPWGRSGTKFGHAEIKDAVLHDGLWDVYSNRAMGNCAEETVKKYGFTREMQDQFAIESFKKAQKAQAEKIFESEIAPLTVKSGKSESIVATDEGPAKANFEKMGSLRPAFEKDGTITAANASTLNDGGAALVLAGANYRDRARFRIVSAASYAHHPTFFTTAPVGAMQAALAKANLKIADIDLFEINEAFACVTMAAMKDLAIPSEKVNPYGGAIALGHPIGQSGARIVVTLMNGLTRRQQRYGMASLCIGGGEGLALIIERL